MPSVSYAVHFIPPNRMKIGTSVPRSACVVSRSGCATSEAIERVLATVRIAVSPDREMELYRVRGEHDLQCTLRIVQKDGELP